jgi:glycerol uptake facilitator-like aquaporin
MGRFTAANYRAVGAEAIATALFVWAGCGSGIATNRWTEADSDAA